MTCPRVSILDEMKDDIANRKDPEIAVRKCGRLIGAHAKALQPYGVRDCAQVDEALEAAAATGDVEVRCLIQLE